MKTIVNRQPREVVVGLSPKSKIRKSSEERKEKLKVEATLRKLVGTEESSSQLDLVLSVISYIRQLQSQLDSSNDENLPELENLFKCAATLTTKKM